MSDGATLFEAVRANPEDMTLRRVYADWCEEQGDQSRADFIRLQLDPERSTSADLLLAQHRRRWDGALLRMLERGPLRGQIRARRGPVHRWFYQRGFVEELVVHPDTFLEHGDELLRLGPLREVRFQGGLVPWADLLDCPALHSLTRLIVRSRNTTLPLSEEVVAGLGHLEMLGLEMHNGIFPVYFPDRLGSFVRLPPAAPIQVILSLKSEGTIRTNPVAGRAGGLQVVLANHRLTRI